jgi:hypothetical protein
MVVAVIALLFIGGVVTFGSRENGSHMRPVFLLVA